MGLDRHIHHSNRPNDHSQRNDRQLLRVSFPFISKTPPPGHLPTPYTGIISSNQATTAAKSRISTPSHSPSSNIGIPIYKTTAPTSTSAKPTAFMGPSNPPVPAQSLPAPLHARKGPAGRWDQGRRLLWLVRAVEFRTGGLV